MAATEALNRTVQAQILETEPPIHIDPNDQYWKAQGGPRIEPRALWMSLTKPEPVMIGNASSLFGVYGGFLKQYAEVTGVTDPRLGAQTKSHQTAFAIDAEMMRGQTRTVDYVNCFTESLHTFLHMELEMLRKGMSPTSVFIPQYSGFVDVNAETIPDDAYIEVFGSASPLEVRQREEKEAAAFKMMIELDPIIREMGGQGLDLNAIRAYFMSKANPSIDLQNYLEPVEQVTVETIIDESQSPAAPPGIPPELAGNPALLAALGGG